MLLYHIWFREREREQAVEMKDLLGEVKTQFDAIQKAKKKDGLYYVRLLNGKLKYTIVIEDGAVDRVTTHQAV